MPALSVGAGVRAPNVVTPKRKINARNKGKRGEREVINDILQPVVNAARASRRLEPLLIQRNTLQAHTGGHDICGLDGWSFEVKRVETEYQESWWQQCLRQAAKSSGIPVLVFRQSRQAWRVKARVFVVTPLESTSHELDVNMSLEDFVDWFTDAYAEQLDAQLGK